jgi:hypothetical protein
MKNASFIFPDNIEKQRAYVAEQTAISTKAGSDSADAILSTLDPDKYTPASLNKFQESVAAGAIDYNLLESRTEMSTHAEKVLTTSQDLSFTSLRGAGEARALANKFREGTGDTSGVALSSGIVARTEESIKEFFGTQDAESEFRKNYTRIKNLEVINNLPPGVASDKDVEIVLAGFPNADAAPEVIANWLDSYARLHEADAEFNRFKSSFISKNNNTKGFLRAWNNYSDVPVEMVEKYRANRTMEGIAANFEKKYGFNPEGLL